MHSERNNSNNNMRMYNLANFFRKDFMKIVYVCYLTFSFTWCGDDCARTSLPPLTFKIQYTKVLLISTDFKLHHSLLSCRQFCWILTSEKKVEWCPVALSYTLCVSDCAGTSHFPFTFQIQYAKILWIWTGLSFIIHFFPTDKSAKFWHLNTSL